MDLIQPKQARDVRAGFAVSAGLLVAVAAVSVWTTRTAAVDAALVTHSMEVRFALAQLLAGLDDAEVGQRGFLGNRLPAQRQTWDAGAAKARDAAQRLLALTLDHATQQERARLVSARVTDLLAGLDKELAATPGSPASAPSPAPAPEAAPEAARAPARAPAPTSAPEATSPPSAAAAPGSVATVTSIPTPPAPRMTEGLLDELRGRVATLDSEEERLLRLRTSRVETSSRVALIFSLGGLLVAGALGLFALRRAERDRTARERATEQLRTQGVLLESVLLEMGDGCLVMDTNQRLLVVNQAARGIFGLNLEGDLPEDWAAQTKAFLPDKKTPYPVERGPLLLATKGIASDRVMMWLAQGRGHWVSVTARPIRGPGGAVIAGVAVVRESNGPGAASSPGIPNAR